jgi:outer membrane protein assembly factor BamD (BamD/ComL family)
MFYSATICFFRKRFDKAGEHYERLSREMPDSDLAAKATKQAFICRMIRIKDEDDTTNFDAARTLIERYRSRYPHDAARDADFVNRQRTAIVLYENERAKKQRSK